MQDPLYRNDVCIQAMGYLQCPMTTRCISAGPANLALLSETGRVVVGEPSQIEVVVSAPVEQSLRGTVRLQAGEDVELAADEVAVDVPAGEMRRYPVAFTLGSEGLPASASDRRAVTALLEGDLSLEASLTLQPLDLPLAEMPRTQATEIAAQGGGEVVIRDDKVGADGDSFSHWDDEGHWVEWTLSVPEAGRFVLMVRYCAIESVHREVSVDGAVVTVAEFSGTGGFSSAANDWAHEIARDAEGDPVVLELPAGEHAVRMMNVDGKGMNVDYLLLAAASEM
jgi:hypothetical protein